MPSGYAIVILLVVGPVVLGCEHTSSNRLNAPRCITNVECGERQYCFKKEHHVDGVCLNK